MPTSAHAPLRIDFVSDVSCPWCAIGLQALEQAIVKVGVPVELHFQPFELNPAMPAEGQDSTEHITGKYGISEQQARDNAEAITARGAAVGFNFNLRERRRVWNTFDAHRLLHWAGEQGPGYQRNLKHALLGAYFSDGANVSDHAVLSALAGSVGLDEAAARAVLSSNDHADAVRTQEQHFTSRGITAVPSIIFNQQHLVQGGQPVETFERVIRQLTDEIAD